jgi:hypothetical protein
VAIFKKYQQQGIPQTQRYKYSDAVNIGNEPIIQKDIPMSVDSQTPTNNQFTRRTNDLGRISKLLIQKPGLKFIQNRSALGKIETDLKTQQATARGKDKEDDGKTLMGSVLSAVGGNLANTGKILATTLLQVPTNGTGTHFVRGDKPGNSFDKAVETVGNFFKKKEGNDISNPETGETPNQFKILEQENDVALEDFQQDYVKFGFTILTPTEDENTPIGYKLLQFNAYLTSLDDNFNGDWNSWKYNGRAENFYTYNGFERTVNIGFKIAASSKKEILPLYRKINELTSVTAPTYSKGGTMKGNFVKVKVGDYLDRVPGIITNVTLNWSTEYPWDIGKELGNDVSPETGYFNKKSKEAELPTVLDCSIAFTPIHSFVPQQGFQFEGTSYIGKKASASGGEDTTLPGSSQGR